jgi:arylsulfate sulfotransferase
MRNCLFLLAMAGASASAMSVSFTPSVESPAPLGTLVTFTAAAIAPDAGPLAYRFRIREHLAFARRNFPGPEFRTVVDYGPRSTFEWATIQREGTYEIEASVRNNATGEVAQESVAFQFTKLVTDQQPAVTPTANPLVFIYSAPPCPRGARMRVVFGDAAGVRQNTPYHDCDARYSMNFYLAGMRANTDYSARHSLEAPAGNVTASPVTFTTGGVSLAFPAAVPLSTPPPSYQTILLQSVLNGRSIATDLNGNLVWYSPPGLTLLTRVNSGGTFLGIFEDGSQPPEAQYFREFDLAGVTIAETNAAAVNEQLAAIGKRPITSFHHEAIRLPGGSYLVLAGSEQILAGVQGPGDVDVLGDTILVLDRDLRVRWVWDSFDHLDPSRPAVLDETCTYPATVACSAFYGAKIANDWLHGNSLQLTPDGNLLYSVRHQDWVVKIDYRSGTGTGNILWRMGAGGDFKMIAPAENPWFSHQHDPQFLSDNQTLILIDNGNTRISNAGDKGSSRGQVLRVDEQARTVTLVLNADLKVNSSALGTAQLLPNGNYHFDAGFIVDPANPAARFSQALEVDPSGNIVWGMQIKAQEYRSYRMDDLYTPPSP